MGFGWRYGSCSRIPKLVGGPFGFQPTYYEQGRVEVEGRVLVGGGDVSKSKGLS